MKKKNKKRRNERTNERNRGACMNGELLFAGLLSWSVGPSFVYSVRLLRLLVPSVAIASSSSSPISPKRARPALASVLLFLQISKRSNRFQNPAYGKIGVPPLRLSFLPDFPPHLLPFPSSSSFSSSVKHTVERCKSLHRPTFHCDSSFVLTAPLLFLQTFSIAFDT